MPHSFGFIDMVAFSEMIDSSYSHAELDGPWQRQLKVGTQVKKCLSPSMSDVVTAVLECGVGTSDNPADGFIDESKWSM